MRFALFGIVCLFIISCREYQSFDTPVQITGYELSSKVISPNGIPLSGVSVTLKYYYYEYGTTPLDTTQIVISGTPKYMVVNVYNPRNGLIKELYGDYPSTGIFPKQYWNETDNNGRYVTSGKYIIRYSYDNHVVKETPYIVEARVTATTDVYGEFSLTGSMLPIGDMFDIYDVDNPTIYYGVFKVSSRLQLLLSKGTTVSHQEIELKKDKLTRGIFTFQ